MNLNWFLNILNNIIKDKNYIKISKIFLRFIFKKIIFNINFFKNKFENIKYYYININIFKIDKIIEFCVNNKFKGFIFILRLYLRKNILFWFKMMRKKIEKYI